jgi:hypothetical protein
MGWQRSKDIEDREGTNMKRILLLVLFIISLVELDLEGNRIYWLSSIISLLVVVWSELTRGRKIQKATPAEALTAGEGASSKVCVAYRPHSHGKGHPFQKVAPTNAAQEEVTLIHGNSS